MRQNNLLDTDSYKPSHYLQFPPGTEWMYSYLESRGGRYDQTVFFGLQYLLKRYLDGCFVTVAEVDEAAGFLRAHGEPFNRGGWMRVAREHQGRLPIRIRAVPEGMVVPTGNVLLSAESTDPACFWLVSWLETQIVRLWYPITVATQSWHIKRDILQYLRETCEQPLRQLPFKLHDFGSRGVSSRESAGIGGMAHLVNFRGSDTIEGVRYANHYYDCAMSGVSIPAAEHSSITMWGKDREEDAYRYMLDQFAQPGAMLACVSDSYDFYRAVGELWCGTLLDQIRVSGATLVIRPDSGHPPTVVRKTLELIDAKVGCSINSLGFKVLPPYFRVIQGDGINQESIRDILCEVVRAGYSAENVTFGMGGALLQQLDRDTQQFAFKCSAAQIQGEIIDVYKDPVTAPEKRSKRGILALVRTPDGELTTVAGPVEGDLLDTVFENGRILRTTTLDQVRLRADEGIG